MKQNKMILIVISFLFISGFLYAQQFSTTFNENYVLYGAEFIGFSNITMKDLTSQENFMSVSNARGTLEVKLENKTVSKGVCTVTLLQLMNGKKLTRLQLVMRSGNFAEFNYLTQFKFIQYPDSADSKTLELKYNGTEKSLGEVLGGFAELISIYYDVKKLKK